MALTRHTRPVLSFLASSLFLLLLPGCRSSAKSGTGEAGLKEWTATENLRIGSLSDASASLTRVGSLAVGPDGSVYLTQPQDQKIREFDPQGNPVRTIGRKGEGPGEFQNLYQMGLLHDTLWAVDFAAGRITFFSLDGKMLGSLSVTPKGLGKGEYPFPPAMLATDGTAISRPGFGITPDMDVNTTLPLRYLRIDREGAIVDTLVSDRVSHAYMPVRRSGQMVMMVSQPFSDALLSALSRDGSRAAVIDRTVPEQVDGATFRVTVLRSVHDTVYSRTYGYTPVPMPESTVDSVVAQRAHQLSRIVTNQADAKKAIRDGIFLPKYVVPVSQALFDESGDLWLQREDMPDRDERWMVLDSAGTPLAHLTLPHGLSVKLVQADALWGTVTDSLDVPYVVRYQLDR